MPDSIPQDWKTDNLFVLVGGNPLPNYVAAHLLLKDKGCLHLVCSNETEKIANKLATYFPDQFIKHTLQDAADRGEIRRVMSDALKKDYKPGTVGLHYTGGTKAMAVHVHQIIREKCSDAILTYLDSRTLTLRCDSIVNNVKVKFLVKPDLRTLLDMHQLSLNEGHIPRVKPVLLELDQLLAKGHASKKAAESYAQWCKDYVYPYENEYKKFQVAKEEGTATSAFLGKTIPFPRHSKLQQAAEEMRCLFEVSGDQFDPELATTQQVGLNSVEELLRYLLGDWVEYLVLQAFLKNQTTHHLHEVLMSVKTQPNPNYFEFDVAAMQGYQLYVVSCTRSTFRDLNKSKLFEVYIRAAQLGGDEAKIALVCCEMDPSRLEDEVQDSWQVRQGRIKVFGASDLPYLSDRFADWLGS